MPINCKPLVAFSDRLYFTTFPHPAPSQDSLNQKFASADKVPPPIKPANNERAPASPPASPLEQPLYYYFTLDEDLLYNSFYMDWGPLNMAMVYKSCILIHELLQDPELTKHRLVLYCSDDPKMKANAALLISLYALIVLRASPWDAFRPVAEMEFMPFRDAGRGFSDFNLSIQDCLWGMWKAVQHGLCDMNAFSVEEYEFYEKVENGDWNWITPGFLAFASPTDTQYMRQVKNGATTSTALQRKLPGPFLNCLNYFEEHNVKLVVRLNNILYDRQAFVDRNMEHVELYFDDGTNPTDEIVRSFIDMSDRIISSGGVVAVHCKAGLGRTGTLIGAYLIWKYGFTANEAIAFMRIARPGSVVGPQQQYMYLKQTEWCKWAAADEIRRNPTEQVAVLASTFAATTPTTPVKAQAPVTPPADEIDELASLLPSLPPKAPITPSRHVAASEAAARAAGTPGQPRKTPKGKRTKADIAEDSEEEDDEISALPMTDLRPIISRLPRTNASNKRKIPQSEHKRSATRTGIENSMIRGRTADLKPKGPPHKMARLDGPIHNTRRAQQPPSPSPVRRARPVSPTTSKLPQLAANKRTFALLVDSPLENGKGTRQRAGAKSAASPDAWMSTENAANVIVPGNKSARPLLRSVRRRRSSFSSADVIA